MVVVRLKAVLPTSLQTQKSAAEAKEIELPRELVAVLGRVPNYTLGGEARCEYIQRTTFTDGGR